jgi:hypothetical protein
MKCARYLGLGTAKISAAPFRGLLFVLRRGGNGIRPERTAFSHKFLSYTASIGPSDKMLPTRLSEGAYKLEALPPSRNRALGQPVTE